MGAPALLLLLAVQAAPSRPVVVASKPFGESYVLAEMFAQLLEARGVAVDRRLGLGATEIAFRALRTGAIDIYPEYTGTGLLAILGESPRRDVVERLMIGKRLAFVRLALLAEVATARLVAVEGVDTQELGHFEEVGDAARLLE